MKIKTISLGCDHGGYDLKEKVKNKLESLEYKLFDKGTNSGESVDYPKFGHLVGLSVSSGESQRGIIICGSGIGISISANKIHGVRAALCTSIEHAKLSRQHNDANIIALGSRLTSEELVFKIIEVWLTSDFEGGRHLDRINQIEK